jgi:hypothetical protein
MPFAPHYFVMESEPQLTAMTKYQQVVRGLLFLVRMMRPEATIQVNLLGRRATNPSAVNMEGAKEFFLYFLSTKKEEIQFCNPKNLDLVIYKDASYRDPISNSRKSPSLAMTTLGGQFIN